MVQPCLAPRLKLAIRNSCQRPIATIKLYALRLLGTVSGFPTGLGTIYRTHCDQALRLLG